MKIGGYNKMINATMFAINAIFLIIVFSITNVEFTGNRAVRGFLCNDLL
jgi:hypothetical protein